MSIQAQTVIDRCTALLDAEGTDHYKFDKDWKFAINNTQVWLVNLYSKLFGGNKISEESLVELTANRVFLPSSNGRLTFSDQGIVVTKTLDNAAAVNNSDGTVKIPCTGHGFDRRNTVTIAGSSKHDGTYQISDIVDVDNFSIPFTYDAETFAGTETAVNEQRIWSVLSIYPEIITIPVSPTPPGVQAYSQLVPAATMDYPVKAAKRITQEEWAEIQVNPMLPGSPLITSSELKTYVYVNMMDYNLESYALGNQQFELAITPKPATGILVAMSYLRQPYPITAVTDYLLFPNALEELIVMKMLQFISIKEDDRYNLFDISDDEIKKALQVLT